MAGGGQNFANITRPKMRAQKYDGVPQPLWFFKGAVFDVFLLPSPGSPRQTVAAESDHRNDPVPCRLPHSSILVRPCISTGDDESHGVYSSPCTWLRV